MDPSVFLRERLLCASWGGFLNTFHVCFFPLFLWPPSCLKPLLSVTPLARKPALHRNTVFPSTISHGAARVALDTQVRSRDSPVYNSSVASCRSQREVQGPYKVHKVLPAKTPAYIPDVLLASPFLLFHTRLVGFFSSLLPCCALPGLSICVAAISSALSPTSLLRSQLKLDLLGDVSWSTHPWSTTVTHQALLHKLLDTSNCLIGSGRRRSPEPTLFMHATSHSGSKPLKIQIPRCRQT